MQTLSAPTYRTAELRQYTHLVWGYGTLIARALEGAEDPRPLLDALLRATERASASSLD